MDCLKSKRAQSTKVIHEARSLFNAPSASIVNLKGMRDCIFSCKGKLSKFNDKIEDIIPEEELEEEYATAEAHNDQAISMPAELSCRIEELERAARTCSIPRAAAPPSNVTENDVSSHRYCQQSLPKLDVPVFKCV